MPYNLTLDIPANREVVDRLRAMDEWVDLRPQYVATNIQPDHFSDRMMVGGGFDDGRYLKYGSNNRNTPYNHFATMATPSAGKFSVGKTFKKVGSVVKPVAKFTYEEVVKPLAKVAKEEGVKLAKEMLKEAIKSALSGDTGAPPSYADSFGHQSVSHNYAPPSYAESFGHQTTGYGRKPRGKGRKPKGGKVSMILSDDDLRGKGHSGGAIGASNTYPATTVRGSGSGGKFNLKNALKSSNKAVGHFVTDKYVPFVAEKVAPVAKFTYEEVVKPLAKVAKEEGVKLAKEMLKEAIKSAISGDTGAPPSYADSFGHQSVSHNYAPPSYYESFGHPTTGYGRKPRGKGRKPRGGKVSMILSDDDLRGKGHSGGAIGASNTYPATTVRGSGSGGKFNLKNALKSSNKAVGHFVTDKYVPFMTEKVAPVAKTVGVQLGRELLPVAFEAVGAEFGIPPQVSGAVGRVVANRLLSEKNTGVKGGMNRAKKCGGGKEHTKVINCGGKVDGRQARALIVKQVMKEKGLKMIDASKYVKAHGLY